MRPDVVAHYRIGEKLGSGGMGDVYRATDTKLGRTVAIKFLPDTLAVDAMHMARFTREAQVLASLNHPNIAAIYGVEDHALVMELVEGESLADRIKAGPVPLEEALAIARQMADALDAAHAKGIVHRDLKPANIKLAPDGTVKVLDFGLAKVVEAAPAVPDLSPTIATTQAGFILGTVGYMAPEQARGKEVDKRADIWAFGVVLYEMLTGAQPFRGETMTDVMAAVVREAPDLSGVPDAVRPLLQRCLGKDPKHRLRDIGDAMLFLDAAATSPRAVIARGRGATRPAWAAVVVLLVALAALAAVHFRETTPALATVRFPLALPPDLSPTGNQLFALSPDGRTVAYAAFGADGVPRIWVRPLDALTWHVLPGSEIERNGLTLFWSPDSRSVVYWADRALKRIDITGGPPQTIADVPTPVFGGAWSRDGVILFAVREGIMQVPAAGGTPAPVTTPAEEELHTYPEFLPDGRHFLYVRGLFPGSRAVHVGSLDAAREAQDAAPLLRSDSGASYAETPNGDGRLLFMRDSTLMAQPFDAGTRTLSGEPAAVAEQLASSTQGGRYFSLSRTGTLAYFTLTDPGVQLTWYTRDGQVAGTPTPPGAYFTIKLSPDATRVAALRIEGGNQDIWQVDLETGTPTRFTFDPAQDIQPVWSADGNRIAWVSRRGGRWGFYLKRSDGSGAEELAYQVEAEQGPSPNLTDWTRDGRFLIYNYEGDIWALPVADGTPETRTPIALVETAGTQLGAYVSPDLQWLAYISNETGQQEIFVQPFSPAGQAQGKWVVSSGTIGMARWRADSRELLFLGIDGGVMAVQIAPGPVFKASPPTLLFRLPRAILTRTGTPGTIVDVTRDHQRFMLSPPAADMSSGLKIVVNWPAS